MRTEKNMVEKIVAVSGYFDPLHVGHIEYFKLAKKLAEQEDCKMLVILNNDKQARLKKSKVFMPQEERRRVIESIRYVDDVYVSIDNDESVCKSLEALSPKFFAQGGDRFSGEVPEAEVCERLGIKMLDGLGEKIQSSSNLIENWEKK